VLKKTELIRSLLAISFSLQKGYYNKLDKLLKEVVSTAENASSVGKQADNSSNGTTNGHQNGSAPSSSNGSSGIDNGNGTHDDTDSKNYHDNDDQKDKQVVLCSTNKM